MEETVFRDQHYELVASCKKGDRKAQAQLYNLYAKAMYNTALRIVSDRDEAADVLQDAFIDAFSRLESFRQESTFGLWMKQIVVNRAISAVRKRRVEFVEINDQLELAEDDGVTEDVEGEVARVKEAIARLPEGYRIVLSLYLLEGYDHEEIAHILQISEGTSRSQFVRAKRKLLANLKEQ